MPLAHASIVLGDAHLRSAPGPVGHALHAFLAEVPTLATHLVINGDLFEFWFEYGTVIPRAAFPTLAALRAVRAAGVALTVIGGNHDRWGGTFWEQQIGATFHPHGATLQLAGWRAQVMHGDSLAEMAHGARLLQRLVHHPLTARGFRWLHPDLGLRLVERLAGRLPGKDYGHGLGARAAAAQREYARRFLAGGSDVDLLILGHTHVPALERLDGGRWYLNPGAWMDGCRYALITREGPELRQWTRADPRP